VPDTERVKAWSELGIAEYLAKGPADAFRSWDRAGDYLFTATDRNELWKEQMVLYGHISAYLARVAETGAPPALTGAGDEYAPPQRGVFMTSNPARLSYFQPTREAALWRVLGYYAEAVGDANCTSKWKARAAEIGRRDSLLALVAEAERDEIPKSIRADGYLAALRLGIHSGQAIAIFKNEIEAGHSGNVVTEQMAAALAQLDDEDRLATEEFGMIIALIPCVLHVATRTIGQDFGETASEEATRLVEACHNMAADSPSAPDWMSMAELIERAYVLGQSATQLSEWSKSLTRSLPGTFHVIARIATTANASPIESLTAMLSVMPRLCTYYPPGTPVYKELLAPFIVAYWKDKFERERFLFGQAMVLDTLLPQAIAAPEDERVVSVFRALHAAFRFSGPLPEEVRHWLFG
jgi:hypothetical protein